ncbi:unnamed protein product, partial [Prorocentrum cordatum]
VRLTQARLDQLLEAEITTLASQALQTDVHPMSLQDSMRDPGELAQLLFDQLPVQYAQRIQMLEQLPDWHRRDEVRNVRQMYVTSFKEMRLADPRDTAAFKKQLSNIKKRPSPFAHEPACCRLQEVRAGGAASGRSDQPVAG